MTFCIADLFRLFSDGDGDGNGDGDGDGAGSLNG